MAEFTKLEHAVFASICEAQTEISDALRTLLLNVRITQRDNTGHGFYTSFEVDRSHPPIQFPKRWIDWPDAEVMVGNRVLLMGFILWLEDGYPKCLEGFQYGTKSGESIDLHREDLGALMLLGPIL
ncbi:hypothetical protein [Beijerinckia indica]|uniref:Uncharacterized protein n=1 Tax=Beijerinckia indica subsp. indica (strain ATCC 9039 / DSM 1715 / NCIMB 8712) TaxID=395963 RepID=B2IDE4_BEII9|nr:hypothetical protein [Beijerinckia indica]ACB93996.1 hypothetical protein Bind_0342 [Beijerinckia indica subsp. indica ATCC 9039]